MAKAPKTVTPKTVTPLTPEAEQLRRRRRRSIALALVLGGLVLIFYVLTIVKMGPGVFNRAL